ncbi:hypothetical protein EJ063_03995 [Vibrio aquaticus]|uniref:Uncharacterized protein n=1 Tax=Vibrio aquaticus TaxID=2496559 RepID=A0A3S0V4W8_9VIBR|nr:hypothetical protein [Vibrio aquaticus]RTZ17959.1 hypothetical protein EJ063_03995 [Vibrio aquaticus]
MNNEQCIDSLKEQLYNAEIAYSWEHKGWGGKYEYLWRWGVSILAGSIFPLFLLIVEDDAIHQPGFWLFSSFSLIMTFVSRYLFFPDKHRCYHLTSLGIHYTEQDMIPEVAFKIVRGFAWVGIAVCIIAVFLLGPLALVGAGACALMSFGMTNFQSTVNQSYVLIDEHSIVFNLTHDSVLSFGSPKRDTLDYVGTIFTATLEQKIELFSRLQSTFPEIETVEIKKLNDKYKHPIYHQEDDKVTE